MNSVKFKVKGYDEASNSLLVSFASDTTASQDPDTYSAVAYQPLTMWPDLTDLEEIKKNLGRAGMYHSRIQAAKEQFVVDEARVAALRAIVGQTFEYSVADLAAPPADTTPLQTV